MLEQTDAGTRMILAPEPGSILEERSARLIHELANELPGPAVKQETGTILKIYLLDKTAPGKQEGFLQLWKYCGQW